MYTKTQNLTQKNQYVHENTKSLHNKKQHVLKNPNRDIIF